MALEALKQIAELQNIEISQPEETEILVPRTKYLLFFVGNEKFALQEKQVVNILREARLYNFPFAPFFIDGIVNSHNRICPAINYKKLVGIGEDVVEEKLHVIVSVGEESFAMGVNAIDDFYMVPDEAFVKQEVQDSEAFVKGKLLFEGQEIPVLDEEALNQKIISSCHTEV